MCGPRYLKDILKFYHQSRTLRSSRDHLRLEEPNLTWKLMASERFPLLPPDYGTSSPLKFELVLMLIFLNLSWKRFFLKWYMTFSFIIFVFFFVFCFFFCLCLMIFLCPFLHCKVLRTAMYKHYINSIIIIMWLPMTNCDTMVRLLLDVQLSKIQFPDTA